MTLWCVALATFGPMCTLLLLRVMSGTPLFGLEAWRPTFWILGAACAATAVFALQLPESPRFLAVRGRAAEAAVAVGRYEVSPPFKSDGLIASRSPSASPAYTAVGARRYLVFLLFALRPWATAAFTILWGAVLTEKGFALHDALLVVGLSTVGPVLGNIGGSMGVDRIDRRHGLRGCCVVMIVAGFAFVGAGAAWQALLGAAIYGMAASAYLSILNLYGAEFFPTEARGRYLARAWALNRIGAAIAPMLLVPLLRNHGSVPMFTAIAAVLVAAMATTYFSPRGKQRLGLS